ncbi:TonB-dependent receptor [Marivirga lumbricoides]|uniref:TonB-dependent receptor n=3 Tax=Marivirga lumbricoides TaxID=1046115 RepID=A0ABQ1LMQ5_9BACT|nr:TonB-dependent receptor [Marivirga lumbricoides]
MFNLQTTTKMLKKITKCVAIIWMCIATNAAVAQYTLSGKITDNQNEPLLGANVYLPELEKGAATDASGNYRIDDITAGSHQIKVTFVGFDEVLKQVNFSKNMILDFTLSPKTFQSEEVTVRAIRAESLAPITQQTLNQVEINEVFNGQDGAFVLETLTPSIQVNSDAGTRFTNYGSMRLRGISQKRINITLNGVPLNDMMDQGVYFSNFTDFTNSIESVQVQRGVGTSTNGTASYAGSISYESENLNQPNPETTVSLLGGSFNTWQGSAEVKTGLLENKTAFYARMSKTYSDGYRYHSGTDSYSMFFSGGYFGEKDVVKVTGFLGKTKNDLAYSPVPLSLIQQDPKTNVNSSNDNDDFGQSLLQVEHAHFFSGQKSITSSVYYGAAGGDFPYGYDDEGTFTQINYPLYNDHFGAMSYYNEQAGNLDWSAGVHAYTFLRENIEQIVPNYTDPYYQDQSTKNEISVFAKASYQLNNLTAFADVQARFVSLDMEPDPEFLGSDQTIPTYNWQFLNPKVGVTYQLNNWSNVYASFGRSGREPNRGDYLGDTQINAGNIDLLQDQEAVQAEYVNDYELGYRLGRSDFQVNVNAFYMDFENEIAPIGAYIPQYFLQLYENQEDSYRTGIELDWNAKIINPLTFSGNATFMRSIISSYSPEGSTETFEDIKTPYSPEVLLNALLQLKATKWLNFGIHGRYAGKSYTELTNNEDFILPSYFVTNARVNTKFAKNYSFEVEWNNIFNERYYTDGAPSGNEMAFFVQAPSHFYCTFTAKF